MPVWLELPVPLSSERRTRQAGVASAVVAVFVFVDSVVVGVVSVDVVAAVVVCVAVVVDVIVVAVVAVLAAVQKLELLL